MELAFRVSPHPLFRFTPGTEGSRAGGSGVPFQPGVPFHLTRIFLLAVLAALLLLLPAQTPRCYFNQRSADFFEFACYRPPPE